MKTIDEAMELLTRFVKSSSDAKAATEQMGEAMDRRESIAKEIGDNPVVLDFCDTYVDNVGPQVDYSVKALALNMFINGVLIGMEMEKQEL